MAAADLAHPTRRHVMAELRQSINKITEEHFSKMRTIISENQKQMHKLFERCLAVVNDGAGDTHPHADPHVSASEQSDNADPDADADVLSDLEFVEDENGLNADSDETNVVVLEEDIESAESKNRHINKIAPELFDENPKKNSDILLEVKKVGSSHEWGNDCTVDDSVHDTCKVDLEGSDLVYGSRIVLTFGAFPRVKLKSNVLFEVIALIRSNGICSSDHANEKGFTDFAIILKEGDISSLNTLADQGNPRSLHIIGEINKQSVQVFIDSGSTHNLIKPGVAELLGLNVQPTSSFRVNIGNGDSLVCQFFCPSVALILQTRVFFIDLYVLPSEGPDVILGIQWLQLLGKVFHDYDALTMEFMWHGASILLRGDTSLCFRKISFNQFQALLSHDTVLCANKITTGLKIIIKYSNHGSVDHKLVDKNPNKAVPMFWTAIDAGTSSAMVTPHLFNIIQCLVETAAYKTLNNADEKMMEYGNQQRRSIFEAYFGILQGFKNTPADLIFWYARGFSEFLDNAKAVHVQGRQYPVDIYYTYQPHTDCVKAALLPIFQIHLEEGPGDILVLLTGQEEIESVERLVRNCVQQLPEGNQNLFTFPIFSSLPSEKQLKVFDPARSGYRKVILATNITETSVTIPGIKYVIDHGLVKAHQRSGRAGREGPGKCFRLYQEKSFDKLLDFHLEDKVLLEGVGNDTAQDSVVAQMLSTQDYKPKG